MAMAGPAAAGAGATSTSTSTTSGGRFKDVPLLPPDAIMDLTRQVRLNTNPNKVDLGIGAYRDDNGQPYLLQVVTKAEALVTAEKSYNHEYIPIDGFVPFREGAQHLMFGATHEVVTQGRVATVQALSGTGALRLGFEFLRRHLGPSPVVFIPNQTWGNHRKLINDAGIADVRVYRYYGAETLSLDFAGMVEDLTAAPEGSVVLLHTTGHNPCGFDPSPEEWQRLAALCQARRLFPFFDNAYQGYTSGSLDDDAQSVRLFTTLGLECFVACSFAKNMGLYGERIGALHAVAATADEAQVVLSQLKAIVRPMYSSPPAHYAKVAAKILTDAGLLAEWAEELKGMAARLQRMRALFKEALLRAGCPGSWEHLARQKGMFGFTGLRPEHVQALKREYSIYLLDNGRISLSGFNAGNVDYVARAFTEVLTRGDLAQPPTPAAPPVPAAAAAADKAGGSGAPAVAGAGGDEPMVLIQPQQPHQVLP